MALGRATRNTETPVNGRYWQNWDKPGVAQAIDDYWLRDEGPWREKLGEDIEARFGHNVPMLEVGCGSGLVYAAMYERGIVTPDSYTGGDTSEKMLEIARGRFPDTSFETIDIFDLPFEDASQPNVICVQVLQHLPCYREALRELARITRGQLYIVSWFSTGPDDETAWSNGFHQNCYSLTRFIEYILARYGDAVSTLQTKHLEGNNYSVSMTLDDRDNHLIQ